MLVTLLMLTLLLGPIVVGILVRFTSFLGTLHWHLALLTWVIFGISFLELLILFEQWAAHRLLSEKVIRPHVRAGRPISLPSVPVSEGIEIRHGCQFLSSLLRALGKLPGGLGRFLPCRLGTHLSRLRHVGWNQCSHGLDSRPLESCIISALRLYVGFWGIPKGSALELLDGTLKLRYYTYSFYQASSPWSLPQVCFGLVKGVLVLLVISWILIVLLVKGSGLPRRRSNISSHVIPDPVPGHSTPRRWKRLLPPSSGGEGREVGVASQYFPPLGWVILHLERLELLSQATGVGVPAGQSAEDASTMVLAFFKQLQSCTQMDRHLRVTYCPHHHHTQPPPPQHPNHNHNHHPNHPPQPQP